MKDHRILPLIAPFVVLGSSLAQSHCGRDDWSRVIYDYVPGHTTANSRAASIAQVKGAGTAPTLVVRKASLSQGPFYSSPNYFMTTNNGVDWDPLYDDVESSVPAMPHLFFRGPSNTEIRYKLIQDLGLYLRSDDGGQRWRLPEYNIEGKSREQIATELGGGQGFHLEASIVAIHPRESNTLFAGLRIVPWRDSIADLKSTQLTGLYRSTDGGEHWSKFTDEILADDFNWSQASALGISPTNPDLMFGDGRHGIEKSTDGGMTWSPVGQVELLEARPLYRREQASRARSLGAPVVQRVRQFLFDPQDSDILYMLSNRGVFKSINQGKSWRLLNLGFDEIDAINSLALNPGRSEQIFAGSRYGIFVSQDGGCTFRRIPSPGEGPRPRARARTDPSRLEHLGQ